MIQGWDQTLGHIHLAKTQNPAQTLCKVTLGPREGIITLWTLATLLTAVLIWVVHHHVRFGPFVSLEDLRPHFEFVASHLRGNGAQKGLSTEGENKQIAAAVLLVGPAFVSAWSLRAEGGGLLRSFLAGARILLLLSAGFAIATALALAEILPTPLDRHTAVEIYAAGSYVVAVPMAVAWVLANRVTWTIFRLMLNNEKRNFLVVGVVALTLALVGGMSELPEKVSGFIVVVLGVVLAAIAANSAGEPLRNDRTGSFYRPLAGLGALPAALFAGSLLGFYGGLMPFETARHGCVGLGLVLLLFSLYGWRGVWKPSKKESAHLDRTTA